MRYIIIIFTVSTILFIAYVYIQINTYIASINDIFIDPKIISYLQSYQKGIITSSTLSLRSRVKIIQIDMKGGVIPGAQISYSYKMLVSDTNNNNNITTIYFPKNLGIFIETGGVYQKVSISSLGAGDLIIIDRNFRFDISGKYDTRVLSTEVTKITI